jgi:hypothetical protein
VDVVVVTGRVTGIRNPSSNVCEGRDLREALTTVGTLPKTVTTSRTEVDDLGILGVNGKAFTRTAAGHVATDLEGEGGEGPCVAFVIADTDCSIVRVPVALLGVRLVGRMACLPTICVQACGSVYLVRVVRIHGHGINAPSAPLRCESLINMEKRLNEIIPRCVDSRVICERRPRVIGIETIQATDVCTKVGNTLRVRMELNARRETAAAAHLDILPFQSGLDGCCRSEKKRE